LGTSDRTVGSRAFGPGPERNTTKVVLKRTWGNKTPTGAGNT